MLEEDRGQGRGRALKPGLSWAGGQQDGLCHPSSCQMFMGMLLKSLSQRQLRPRSSVLDERSPACCQQLPALSPDAASLWGLYPKVLGPCVVLHAWLPEQQPQVPRVPSASRAGPLEAPSQAAHSQTSWALGSGAWLAVHQVDGSICPCSCTSPPRSSPCSAHSGS